MQGEVCGALVLRRAVASRGGDAPQRPRRGRWFKYSPGGRYFEYRPPPDPYRPSDGRCADGISRGFQYQRHGILARQARQGWTWRSA